MALADSEIAEVHPYERSNSPGQRLAVSGESASFEDGNGYRSKVTVKWPTKLWNLRRKITAKLVELRRSRCTTLVQTCLATNQVETGCVNADF